MFRLFFGAQLRSSLISFAQHEGTYKPVERRYRVRELRHQELTVPRAGNSSASDSTRVAYLPMHTRGGGTLCCLCLACLSALRVGNYTHTSTQA